MDEDLDYAHIYKTLKLGVKKGFFKKSSHDNSGADFACVSKSLASQECPELAAIFLLGKAQCEAASKNTLSEASTLFTAAKCFLQAEDKLDCLNAVTYEENLDSATSCLLKAAKLYESNELFTLAANVYIFLCDNLIRYRKYSETIPHLKRTLEILARDVMCSLQVLSKLFCCQISLGDWLGALNTCLRIQSLIKEVEVSGKCAPELHSEYWAQTEIFRVCLILLTSPPPKLSAERTGQGYSLDNYSLEATGVESALDETLFLHLQSLILAYRSGDVVELETTLSALRPFLDADQCDVLSLLVHELTNPFDSVI